MRPVIASVFLLACTAERTVQLPDEPVQQRVTVFDRPEAFRQPLDALVVIESSPAMAIHEANVVAQLPVLADTLQRLSDDLHVGIVTADLADHAMMRHAGALVGSPFLIDWHHLDGTRTANYAGAMRDVLPQLARVGHAGAAEQQPIAAVREALENPRNTGFHRDGAALLILIIAATDDHSDTLLGDEIAYLKNTVDEPRDVLVAMVHDRNAPRLDAFAARFAERSVTSASIRDAEFGTKAMPRWFGPGDWGESCIDDELAVPYDCSISDVVIDDNGAPVRDEVLVACAPGSPVRPCWRFEHSEQVCWAGDHHLKLQIDRRDWPKRETHVIGSCVTAVSSN